MNKEKYIKKIKRKLWDNFDFLLDEKEAEFIANYLYEENCKKKYGWINVDFDFPKEEGYYLVWNSVNKMVEKRYFHRLSPNQSIEGYPNIKEYFGKIKDYKNITHWMLNSDSSSEETLKKISEMTSREKGDRT